MDQNFFNKSFTIYREKYNDNFKKVIFLAVSDDNEWIKVDDKIESLHLSQSPYNNETYKK